MSGMELSKAALGGTRDNEANLDTVGKFPKVCIVAENCDWSAFAADCIAAVVRSVVQQFGACNLMLTGGATAERLYLRWDETEGLPWEDVHFFFGDERCVPPDHPGSNYAMAMRSLCGSRSRHELSVRRMEAEAADSDGAAHKYERDLPSRLDVLLLGMGEDGHVASLFPYGAALEQTTRRVVPVTCDLEFRHRLTITPSVINAARAVFLLATGAGKGRVLAEALSASDKFKALPVRLTTRGTWLLDHEAGRALQESEYSLNWRRE